MKEQEKISINEKPKPEIPLPVQRSNPVVHPNFAIYNDDVTIIQLKEDRSLLPPTDLTPEELEKMKRREKRRERRNKRKNRSEKKNRGKSSDPGVVSFCNPLKGKKLSRKEIKIQELKNNSNEMPEDPMCALI